MTKNSSTSAGSSGRDRSDHPPMASETGVTPAEGSSVGHVGMKSSQGAKNEWKLERAQLKKEIREKDAIIKEKDTIIKYQKGQHTELTIQLDTIRKETRSPPIAQNDAATEPHEISATESETEVEILAEIRPEDRVHEIIDLDLTPTIACIEPEIENVADINLLDLEGETALHRAVMQGDVAAVRDLIRRGVDVNVENEKGMIPLQLAYQAQCKSSQSCLGIIKILVDGGADVYNMWDLGRTFLHSLCCQKISPAEFTGLAEYLVSKGFGDLFNKPDESNTSPFHIAVHYVEVEKATLKLLKENGVNISALDEWGDGALEYAISGNRTVGFLSNLIELGVDLKLRNKQEENLLHIAAARGHAEQLKFLLTKKGLDVNGRDVYGNTPLHTIVKGDPREGHEDCLRLLLQNGADKTVRNNEMLTPLELAKKNGGPNKEDILQLLRIIE